MTAASASAHTPAISADCSGLHLSATSYDADQANTWTVTIGGVTQSGTFSDSFDQTFPVPQSGATTSWSADIAAYDGAYDSGVQSGSVGPCGESDACTDLPGNQPPGTACTPPPTTVRSDSGTLHGCDVAFQGEKHGAGVLTYDTLFEDAYVFNTSTNAWDVVTDETGEITNVEFTRWTKAQQVAAGCVEKPGGSTIVKGEQATAKPQPKPQPTPSTAVSVPTVIDAGLASAPVDESPIASSGGSAVSLASMLVGAGAVLMLGASIGSRRRSRS